MGPGNSYSLRHGIGTGISWLLASIMIVHTSYGYSKLLYPCEPLDLQSRCDVVGFVLLGAAHLPFSSPLGVLGNSIIIL
jgi:hypothetical protein